MGDVCAFGLFYGLKRVNNGHFRGKRYTYRGRLVDMTNCVTYRGWRVPFLGVSVRVYLRFVIPDVIYFGVLVRCFNGYFNGAIYVCLYS